MNTREASDAGLLHWRENFIYFILFFALPFWVFAFALRMLPGRMQYLSWIILWWLKPLFDRLVLHIISVRFFEPDAGIKRLLKNLRKSIITGLAGDLLWRRLNPYRSAMMPIFVLEQGSKSDRNSSERKKILKQNGLGYCSFLTIWGLLLEAALLIGEIIFVFVIMEILGREFFIFSREFIVNAEIYIFTAWCFNYMLVETIYVCMGFSLYINSRIKVEGWDIEIQFRKFAEKLKNKNILLVFAFFSFLLIFSPVNTCAEENDVPGNFARSGSLEVPLESLQYVLDSPEFGGYTDYIEIRLRERAAERVISSYTPLSERLRLIIAYFLRFIIIVSVSLIIIYLFFISRKLLRKKSKLKENNISFSSLQDIETEHPRELLKKAETFYSGGNLRAAWGYCTASAIYSWKFYRNIDFPSGATESECENIVSANLSFKEEAKMFAGIINNWINFAYAGRFPEEGSFEEAVSFCKLLESKQGQINE